MKQQPTQHPEQERAPYIIRLCIQRLGIGSPQRFAPRSLVAVTLAFHMIELVRAAIIDLYV
jgi:hypothetical protein